MLEGGHNSTRSTTTSPEDDALNELTAQLSNFNWKDGVVDKARRLLYSDDIQDNIKGVLNLKSMLCIGREEVYEVAQEVIDSGVIVRLVEFLKIDNHDLQWPAAFCLTNIAAGHDAQTQTVVDAGAIGPLIAFLQHPEPQLRRQAIFCLANVAGSTEAYRIMLARDPNYFTFMCAAGDMIHDNKVLELVCWNLRNVCLLGGPQFHEIQPGVVYLLNRILKRYWDFQYWSPCLKFAMETVCAACRTPEGRYVMIEQDVMNCLLTVIEFAPSSSANSMVQSAFEALSWIIAFGGENERQQLVRDRAVIKLIIGSAIQGICGAVVQELSLKCLACIAADGNTDRFVSILESYDILMDVAAQIFLGHLAADTNTTVSSVVNNPSTPRAAIPSSAAIRESAAFIFTNCLLFTPYIPKLLIKLLSRNVIKVLMEVIEFGSEQTRQQLAEEAGLIQSTLTGCGPNMSSIADALTVSGLKALAQQITRGEMVQKEERLAENPILKHCFEYDVPSRLRSVLNSTSLPQEGYEVGNALLNHFVSAAPRKSSIFG